MIIDKIKVDKFSSVLPAAIAIALVFLLMLLSCAELEQKYIRKDKLFKIASMEDSRVNDSILISDGYISNPDPDIRARAAMAIGRIGGGFYTRALEANLRDTVFSTAAAKYFAAGLIGDSTLFDSLFSLAQSVPIARDAAVQAMGRLADSNQAPRLTEFLTDPDSLVVYEAMLALWRADHWSDAERMANIGLSTGYRKVRYGALYALARAGRIEGRELYLNTLADSDPEFRMLAYDGLGRSTDTSSIQQIAGGLNDADYRVVASAMYALNRFDDMGAMYIGKKMADIEDEKLTALAVSIIGNNPGFSGSTDIIRQILLSDTRDNVLAEAAGALLKIEGVKALVDIDKKLPTPTTTQKLAIAESVTGLGSQAAMARLTPLINDPAPIVRATALGSLCDVDSNSAASYITTALADSDFVVLSTAVEMAADRGFAKLIPTIASLYLDNRNTIDDDLKRTIIDAWNKFEKDPEYDSIIVATLKEGCNDEWFFIRREASKVLWEKYQVDLLGCVQGAKSKVEKRNFSDLYHKYETNPFAVLETSRGNIVIELLYSDAPLTVNNFISLAEDGYYNDKVFHRVVPNFVIQDGCPRGDGWGGPGYTIRCEYNRLSYTTGMVGMALSGKDTGGSQYFINLSPTPHLDARYTIFGKVVEGMDVAQQMVRGDSIMTVTIQYNREET